LEAPDLPDVVGAVRGLIFFRESLPAFNGVTKTDSQMMVIALAVIPLKSIAIGGPAQVAGGKSAAFTATATFGDGSTATVTTGKAHGCAGAGAGGGFFGLLLVGIMARRRVARRGLR
jgi:hypothetical protein